jgi:hypothetical protein
MVTGRRVEMSPKKTPWVPESLRSKDLIPLLSTAFMVPAGLWQEKMTTKTPAPCAESPGLSRTNREG